MEGLALELIKELPFSLDGAKGVHTGRAAGLSVTGATPRVRLLVSLTSSTLSRPSGEALAGLE